MKVAICFSGAIRYFDKTYPSLQKYILNNFPDADIFMHMWEMNNESIENLEYNFKWVVDNSDTKKIIELLKPKDYVIDIFNNNWENIIKSESNISFDIINKNEKNKNYGFNCISMYWKIMKCYELAKNYSSINNFKYDLIMRIRLDFIWEKHITPELFLPIEDNVYLIQDRYATLSNKINNDKFFAGNEFIMDKMSNIFKYIKFLYNKKYILDGQVINEAFIKEFNINHKWIGDINTYYKCMSRHTKISNYKKNILIHDLNNNIFLNNLSYELLKEGFNVNSYLLDDYNKYFTIYKELNIKNEKLYDYNIKINGNVIYINDTQLKFNNNLLNNILNKNNYYLIDFIISFLKNNNRLNYYYFNNIENINNIQNNEKIIYKYLDKGYYNCSFINFNDNNNKYIILLSNKIIQVNRNNFKIVNLINYYKNGFLPINF